MNREYHEWLSSRLGRSMELLIFGHAGTPVLVFPTSCGRFYDFEDQGMVAAVAGRIDAGEWQLFCVDSVDRQSWYNRQIAPRRRLARHMAYEDYLLREVVPLIRQKNLREKKTEGEEKPEGEKNREAGLLALGCSFGGYHAVNIALRHPDIFSGFFSLSGAFDLTGFLDGYSGQDSYFHLPTQYLPNLNDPWYLDRMRGSSYVLATGWDDQCLAQNQNLDRILNEKEIPHRFHVLNINNSHDWQAWRQMVQNVV